MNIPKEMRCHCREPEISPAEAELARRFGMDPVDAHRFMDEWARVAGQVAQEQRRNRRWT